MYNAKEIYFRLQAGIELLISFITGIKFNNFISIFLILISQNGSFIKNKVGRTES